MLRLAALSAVLGGVLPGAFSAQPAAAVPGASGYQVESRWKQPGDGGWGDLTLDAQTHRLYVARANSVQIIDTEKGTLVHEIPGLEGGRGVALAPELDLGFATSGESGTVLVFNLTSLRTCRAPLAVGKEPGAIVYEPFTRRVFVFNTGSKDASVIDAATTRVVATLPLGGAAAAAVSDGGGTVFVNLADTSELLAIDGEKNTVTHRWPLAPGAEPAGLAFDPLKRRLFAGCRNGQMIVLDARTGKRLAALPIGKEVNACAFDPGSGLAFASCGDGTLTVVQENPAQPGEFRVLESVGTQKGARTMALDSITHAVYLAAADFEAAPALTKGEKSVPPTIVPGSFVLLKFTR